MSSLPGGTPAAAVVGAVASEPRVGAAYSASEASATDFWSLLVNAQTSDQLCRAWLGILCQWIPGTQAGLLLLHEEGDRYAPAAVWPDPERDMSFLAGAAQEALVDRRGVVRNEASGLAQCAYPLLGAQQTYGVVVLHVVARGEAGMRDALRLLHWGAGWLVGLFDRRQLLDRETRLRRSGLLQDLMLGVLAEQDPQDAARWVVNRLVEALPCRTAMIGRVPQRAESDARAGRSIDLLSVSGTASFEERSNLLSVAREAMREAVDRGAPQLFPTMGAEQAPLVEAAAIADYRRDAQAASVMVLPLLNEGRAQGALLLDFSGEVSPALFDFAQTLALALAPVLHTHRQAHRGLLDHARGALADGRAALFGPRHPGAKLAGAVALVALMLAAVIPVDYRVSSAATVEGRIQRAAVAPFPGYIREAQARAGDRVKAGDVLARLDDRDLRLEEIKSSSQFELADRKLREAMARGDAVAVRLAQAEADQAQAELNLVRERLRRVAIVAPFDGVVVRGDLTQQLGAPVEQGKVLFEVAPLDAYRVILKVDERDITRLRGGAPGELVLAGLPGERFPIRVSQVAPVATAEGGTNTFRVEAEVRADAKGAPAAGARIQPGMEGVGKVEAGERSLLWVATHRFTEWARYALWSLGL